MISFICLKKTIEYCFSLWSSFYVRRHHVIRLYLLSQSAPKHNQEKTAHKPLHTSWIALWSSSNSWRRNFIAVWPPNASWHKLIASQLCIRETYDFLRLAWTCEPTCESVWPAIASPYASSGLANKLASTCIDWRVCLASGRLKMLTGYSREK